MPCQSTDCCKVSSHAPELCQANSASRKPAFTKLRIRTNPGHLAQSAGSECYNLSCIVNRIERPDRIDQTRLIARRIAVVDEV